MKKMERQNNVAKAPKTVEVEWVLDYRGAEPVCLGEDLKVKGIKIRFLPKATGFCPPVYHTLNQSHREQDSTRDPVSPIEGNHC
jgi:hypothetical protein